MERFQHYFNYSAVEHLIKFFWKQDFNSFSTLSLLPTHSLPPHLFLETGLCPFFPLSSSLPTHSLPPRVRVRQRARHDRRQLEPVQLPALRLRHQRRDGRGRRRRRQRRQRRPVHALLVERDGGRGRRVTREAGE